MWTFLTQWFLWRFVNAPTPIYILFDCFHFEEDLALYLNKLESPTTKGNLYQLWIWLADSEEKIFLLNFQCMFNLLLLSALGEYVPLHLNKLEFPYPKGDLCQVWLKLAQWFWKRSPICQNLQIDRRTDRRSDR
jgi:hypothetical protein